MKKRRRRAFFLFALACFLTIMAGRYGRGLFTISEFVHFSINFPEDTPSPRASILRPGPWARISNEEWSGYPKGGYLAWGRENLITVDIGRRGLLKRLLQPRTLLLSSHWIRNIGDRPYRIRMELFVCDMPQVRVTFEKHWDDARCETTRYIRPGESFNLDWIIELDSDWQRQDSLCQGYFKISDAESSKVLTTLPVHVVNSLANEGLKL